MARNGGRIDKLLPYAHINGRLRRHNSFFFRKLICRDRAPFMAIHCRIMPTSVNQHNLRKNGLGVVLICAAISLVGVTGCEEQVHVRGNFPHTLDIANVRTRIEGEPATLRQQLHQQVVIHVAGRRNDEDLLRGG